MLTLATKYKHDKINMSNIIGSYDYTPRRRKFTAFNRI